MQQTKDQLNIFFEQGLPGFESLRNFLVSRPFDNSPFYYLQSAEVDHICFLLLNPFEITQSYEFDLPVPVQEMLEIKATSDIAVFNIVNAQKDLANATVNLQAPVVINVNKSKGMQVVLNDPSLSIREPLKNLLQGKVGRGC
ncbi:MAG: flagellar assembly protein FliW [Clostridia bacterium]|nr:flagellar assembly protein FliW [Bacillota bacterium]MDA8210588.1 flagellar assembly protein FliW [Clostridia bacterium]